MRACFFQDNTMGQHSFEITFIVYASPQKVYEALTNQQLIQKWSNGKAVFNLKKNAPYEMFDGWAKGEIIEFELNKSLSYTWKTSEWSDKIKFSTVHITLSKNIAGTKVEIEHINLPSKEESDKHKEGWITFVLEPLNDFFIKQM